MTIARRNLSSFRPHDDQVYRLAKDQETLTGVGDPAIISLCQNQVHIVHQSLRHGSKLSVLRRLSQSCQTSGHGTMDPNLAKIGSVRTLARIAMQAVDRVDHLDLALTMNAPVAQRIPSLQSCTSHADALRSQADLATLGTHRSHRSRSAHVLTRSASNSVTECSRGPPHLMLQTPLQHP